MDLICLLELGSERKASATDKTERRTKRNISSGMSGARLGAIRSRQRPASELPMPQWTRRGLAFIGGTARGARPSDRANLPPCCCWAGQENVSLQGSFRAVLGLSVRVRRRPSVVSSYIYVSKTQIVQMKKKDESHSLIGCYCLPFPKNSDGSHKS
jgi:hypothetical protein